MKFVIEKEIFQLFPGLQIVGVMARDIPPAHEDEAIAKDLQEAWSLAGAASKEFGNAQSHPCVKPWGERMKAAGAPRKDFPSSIEALLRRAGKTPTPVSIHPLVDFYNAVSLRYLVPAGGYDVDALKEGLSLRLSREGDTFQALDSDEVIPVPAGEVSYADGDIIITRHFLWKQSKHAILTPESRNAFFVSEILGELPPETAGRVIEGFKDGLSRFFGVSAEAVLLNADRPAFEG